MQKVALLPWFHIEALWKSDCAKEREQESKMIKKIDFCLSAVDKAKANIAVKKGKVRQRRNPKLFWNLPVCIIFNPAWYKRLWTSTVQPRNPPARHPVFLCAYSTAQHRRGTGESPARVRLAASAQHFGSLLSPPEKLSIISQRFFCACAVLETWPLFLRHALTSQSPPSTNSL